MEDFDDFLESFLSPDKPPRDGSGRPLLIPRGATDGERVAYTRASGLADVLEEFSFLWKWKMRGLAVGLAQNMDLVRLAAAETYTCGFTDDEQANRASGRRVDEVIERALDRAGVDMKADYGTAIHARTEPGNTGTDPDEKQAADVASCWQLWADLGVVNLATEVFTANDELRVAGTFDHLSWVPGYGIIVTDKKTSAKAKSSYDIQLSTYTNGDVYDPETDQRLTLEEYIASLGWDPSLLNRDAGLIWWVKNGKTEARFLDLRNGYRWAKVAAEIRDERRPAAARVAPNVGKRIAAALEVTRGVLMDAIAHADSLDRLYEIHGQPVFRAVWTDSHTEAAMAKKEEL